MDNFNRNFNTMFWVIMLLNIGLIGFGIWVVVRLLQFFGVV